MPQAQCSNCSVPCRPILEGCRLLDGNKFPRGAGRRPQSGGPCALAVDGGGMVVALLLLSTVSGDCTCGPTKLGSRVLWAECTVCKLPGFAEDGVPSGRCSAIIAQPPAVVRAVIADPRTHARWVSRMGRSDILRGQAEGPAASSEVQRLPTFRRPQMVPKLQAARERDARARRRPAPRALRPQTSRGGLAAATEGGQGATGIGPARLVVVKLTAPTRPSCQARARVRGQRPSQGLAALNTWYIIASQTSSASAIATWWLTSALQKAPRGTARRPTPWRPRRQGPRTPPLGGPRSRRQGPLRGWALAAQPAMATRASACPSSARGTWFGRRTRRKWPLTLCSKLSARLARARQNPHPPARRGQGVAMGTGWRRPRLNSRAWTASSRRTLGTACPRGWPAGPSPGRRRHSICWMTIARARRPSLHLRPEGGLEGGCWGIAGCPRCSSARA